MLKNLSILFISHDASRTGAPIVLYNFLKWLKQNTDLGFYILLVRGGELAASFSELAPTFVLNWHEKISIREQRLSYRVLNKLGVSKPICYRILRLFGFTDYYSMSEFLKLQYQHSNISLIYSNTAVNGLVLESLKSFLDCPVVSHIHELESVISTYANPGFEHVLKYSDHYLACAEIVKDNLIKNHHVPNKQITVIHEFIPIIEKKKNLKLLQCELNLPENAFVVGASGSVCWRKGSDLFVQVAKAVIDLIPDRPIYFIWLGLDSINMIPELNHDLQKLGLDNRVYYIGARSNAIDYFASFDIFLLLSREDPYPLVCLENASVGNPIICFEQSGGMPEFIESDCGFVVPYLDIDAVADAVMSLYKLPSLRSKLGLRAASKVRERHDLDHEAHKIVGIIVTTLSSSYSARSKE